MLIERLCNKYHKLPSDVLREDIDDIMMLVTISMIDSNEQDKKQRIDDVKNKVRQRTNGN